MANDTLIKILIGVGIGLIVLLCAYFMGKRDERRGLSGTGRDSRSVRDLEREASTNNQRTGDNNQQLADLERQTAEGLREQAADIKRAGELNQQSRAANKSDRDNIQRAKEILDNCH